jgi:hypothetical protein
MATPITMWAARDGTPFKSEAEADAHDSKHVFRQWCELAFGGRENWADGIADALLEDWDMTPKPKLAGSAFFVALHKEKS